MPTDTDIFESLRQELRRGTLILAVLAQLREERYGYSLRQALASVGVEIDEGALYPMLRRLEAQGLLASELARGRQAQEAFLPAVGRGPGRAGAPRRRMARDQRRPRAAARAGPF